MLSALNDLAPSAVDPEAHDPLGVLIGTIDEPCIPSSHWAVIHPWHIVITEAVDVVLVYPKPIQLEEIAPCKFLAIIHPWAARKELALEDTHHRARLAEHVIHEVVRKFGMGIDSVQNDRNASLVAEIGRAH